MPRTRRLAELETRELKGVEILAPGTWNGDAYTDADIDAIIASFTELKGTIDPPGKLGHDKGQALAQNDGFPAIGWVEKVYKSGAKLLADFTKVPAKIAELIAAGAYDKVSSEIYFDLDLNGKTYSRVLRAVSFLGADLPAVKDIKSISDVAALYTDANGKEPRVAEYEWGDDLPATTIGAALEAALEDALHSKILYFRRYSLVTEAEEDQLQLAAEAAEQAFMAVASVDVLNRPIAGKLAGGYYIEVRPKHGPTPAPKPASTEDPDMDIKILRETLGLPETADEAAVMAKLAEMKAAAETKPAAALSETEVRELRDRVLTLETEKATQTATKAVDDAIQAGKFMPAQRDHLMKYALSDLEGFKSLSEATPKIAALSGPIGADPKPNDPSDPPEVTSAERHVASLLGVGATELADAKKNRSAAELIEQARAKQPAGAR